MAKPVKVFDTTLRDGAHTPGVSMDAGNKLKIARGLEALGVDIIEAGFPAVLKDDAAIAAIAGQISQPEIAVLTGADKADIDRAWHAVKTANTPRIHIFIPTSDIQLAHHLKISREQVLTRTCEAVVYAKKFTESIEFTADDGTRTDRDFLCRIFDAAIQSGATTVNLADTVGHAVPDEFARLVKYVKSHTPHIHKAVLSVHCHNDLGLANANTLAAMGAGVGQIEVTVNGLGARSGNTALEEVAMTLFARKNIFPFTTGINTQQIYAASRLVSDLSHIPVQPGKAVVGSSAFTYSPALHADIPAKDPVDFELLTCQAIGRGN